MEPLLVGIGSYVGLTNFQWIVDKILDRLGGIFDENRIAFYEASDAIERAIEYIPGIRRYIGLIYLPPHTTGGRFPIIRRYNLREIAPHILRSEVGDMYRYLLTSINPFDASLAREASEVEDFMSAPERVATAHRMLSRMIYFGLLRRGAFRVSGIPPINGLALVSPHVVAMMINRFGGRVANVLLRSSIGIIAWYLSKVSYSVGKSIYSGIKELTNDPMLPLKKLGLVSKDEAPDLSRAKFIKDNNLVDSEENPHMSATIPTAIEHESKEFINEHPDMQEMIEQKNITDALRANATGVAQRANLTGVAQRANLTGVAQREQVHVDPVSRPEFKRSDEEDKTWYERLIRSIRSWAKFPSIARPKEYEEVRQSLGERIVKAVEDIRSKPIEEALMPFGKIGEAISSLEKIFRPREFQIGDTDYTLSLAKQMFPSAMRIPQRLAPYAGIMEQISPYVRGLPIPEPYREIAAQALTVPKRALEVYQKYFPTPEKPISSEKIEEVKRSIQGKTTIEGASTSLDKEMEALVVKPKKEPVKLTRSQLKKMTAKEIEKLIASRS